MAPHVEEQGFQCLENVCLARVVLTKLAASLRRLDGLEERTEDGGADTGPVEGAGSHKFFAHFERETGNVQGFRKNSTIDIGESGN